MTHVWAHALVSKPMSLRNAAFAAAMVAGAKTFSLGMHTSADAATHLWALALVSKPTSLSNAAFAAAMGRLATRMHVYTCSTNWRGRGVHAH